MIFFLQIDEMYSTEKITAIASVKSENAALQVRLEGLQAQVNNQIKYKTK